MDYEIEFENNIKKRSTEILLDFKKYFSAYKIRDRVLDCYK